MRGVEETDATPDSFEELLRVAAIKIKNCFSFIFSARERASERNFANPDSVFEVKRFHTDAKKQLIFPLNNKTFR